MKSWRCHDEARGDCSGNAYPRKDFTVMRCRKHWREAVPPPTVLDRVLAKIEVSPTGCHLYRGNLDRDGYGTLGIQGPTVRTTARAHRIVYEALVGPIPDGLQIDHLCRTPACVNVEHMEPVTPRENTLRGNAPTAINARKTHCIHGHEYTPENTGIDKRRGWRYCKECDRVGARRAYWRARGVAA